MKCASTRGARFATIEGDDERARLDVTVKDLSTGEQTSVPARGRRKMGRRSSLVARSS